MPDLTQGLIKKILYALEIKHSKNFKEKFKTFTVDNVSEFLDFKGIEESFLKPREKKVMV